MLGLAACLGLALAGAHEEGRESCFQGGQLSVSTP